ncbi:MAG: hypothetical protein ABF649_21225 [Bacillus sp. (in: firmicutes)]
MREFFNGIFSLFYGFFAVPLLLIFIIIAIFAVNEIRKRKRNKTEEWHGQSPVEKIEKEDKTK